MSEVEELRAEVDRLREAVASFIVKRVEYVNTLRQCTETDSDYHRWQGHAEARRQLANALRVPVPYDPGDVEGVRAALSPAESVTS